MKNTGTKIMGPDGPTSVFLLKRSSKLTVRQKLSKFLYDRKRAYVERTLKAEGHSIDKVMEYLVKEHGFVELDKDSEEVKQEYSEMRTSFLMQHAPELLGEHTVMPKLEGESEEAIRAYFKQVQDIKQRAAAVPASEFDIEFHKFQKSCKDINDNIHITVETKFEYIGGGASGSKRIVKKFRRIYKDIYRYYGVSEEDIRNKSKRYHEVVRALSRRR